MNPAGRPRLADGAAPSGVVVAAAGPSDGDERAPLLSSGGQGMTNSDGSCWKSLLSCLCCCCGGEEEEPASTEEQSPSQWQIDCDLQAQKQELIDFHNDRAYCMAADAPEGWTLRLCPLGSFGGLTLGEINQLPPCCVDTCPTPEQMTELLRAHCIPPDIGDFPGPIEGGVGGVDLMVAHSNTWRGLSRTQ